MPTPTIRKAVVKAYAAPSNTATVQVAGSLPAYLAGIPVADDIDPALMTAGRNACLLFFDDASTTDAVIACVW